MAGAAFAGRNSNSEETISVGNLYWSIVVLLFGGCIGSFLNVVVFRWPRDLSVRKPARSFCPDCGTSIAWYDNIPVLSYLLLRGRCRKCGCSISLQYPLVELATALVFLMTYDALFVTRLRAGFGDLGADWSMLLAHLVLWAGMIALAVMDLEAYLVDIRVTWILSAVGLLAHTLWTPAGRALHLAWVRPGPEQAGAVLAAGVGLLVGGMVFLRKSGQPEDGTGGSDAEAVEEASPGELLTGAPAPSRGGAGWMWLLLAVGLVVVYEVGLVRDGFAIENQPVLPFETAAAVPSFDDGELASISAPAVPASNLLRIVAGLVASFLGLTLAASLPHPEADQGIVEAIADEAADSRRNALWELQLLSPALVLGMLALALLMVSPGARSQVQAWLDWQPVGHWRPLLGLATGLSGWLLAGAVGWLARIVFTLVFRKEALGMGDVHILAAAGAVAGWPVAVTGFFLASPLTLLATVVIRLRRQSRALPYGPWLGLAFLIACLFQDRILMYLGFR